jgi:leader peptidase (prepilin peptidase) / N-methyltransferase
MTIPAIIAVGAAFAALGGASERLASVWPTTGARRGRAGLATLGLAVASALAAAAVAARSEMPWWGTAVYLVLLALLIVLTATDLEQRRLPHLVLDPLIVLAAAFVPFNPAVAPVSAVVGAISAFALLGALALVVRGGLARGDLLLVLAIGFMLGFPSVFIAVLAASLLVSMTSIILMARRRVGLRTYVPFGPFLVAGTVIALLFDERVIATLR